MSERSPEVKNEGSPGPSRPSSSLKSDDRSRSQGQVKIISGWHSNVRSSEASPRPVHYHVAFKPHSLPRKMLYVVLGLLAAHTIIAYYHYEIGKLPWLFRQIFDLDEENNLPSWYSGTALFVTTVFVWLCAREKRAVEDPWTRQWYVLTAGFLFLAIDEIAGLHETFNSLVRINWAIPGGVLAVAIGFMFAPFLIKLHRRTSLLFLLSGIVYVGGAIGVELLSAPLKSDSLNYYLMTLLEEGMEMLGVLIFLYALLAYMSGHAKNRIKVVASLRPSQASS